MKKPRAPGDAGTKLRANEVLDTAARVFHARGYASASVQVIADELGILKGSLYYYIDSKENLLFQLLEDVHDELGLILDAAVADDRTPPIDRLYSYVERQVQYAANNLEKIAIYYRDSDQLSEKHRAQLDARRREHQLFVRELLKLAQERGDVAPDEDIRVLANLVFGSFIWTYRWFDPKGTLQPDEIAAAAARFAVRAVRT